MMNFTDFMDHLKFFNQHSALPAIIFFLCFRKHFSKVSQIAFLIVVVSFVADLVNHYLIWMVMLHKFSPGFTSYLISNIWRITDYFLVSWLFLTLLPEKRKLILGLAIAFILGGIISFSTFYSFFRPNSFIGLFWSAAVSILSIVTFAEIIAKASVRTVLRYPVFWFVAALFLFSTSMLLINVFQDYLVFELSISSLQHSYAHFFTIFFNLVKNLLFFLAFVLAARGNPEMIEES